MAGLNLGAGRQPGDVNVLCDMSERFGGEVDHVEPDAAERVALSASWEDRAHAARVLAERSESSDLVDTLLFDPNLAVAVSAAEGLLTRADEQAVKQFTSAYVRADDQLGDHFNDVLRVAVHTNPDILRTLQTLSDDGDLGARMGLAWLTEAWTPPTPPTASSSWPGVGRR
jgi:hypothetical protein